MHIRAGFGRQSSLSAIRKLCGSDDPGTRVTAECCNIFRCNESRGTWLSDGPGTNGDWCGLSSGCPSHPGSVGCSTDGKVDKIRGLVAACGLVTSAGIRQLRQALPRWLEDAENGLTDDFRILLADRADELRHLIQHLIGRQKHASLVREMSL